MSKNDYSKRYDFVVVGGGSAGCAASAKLVEAGYHVALVEAGPDYGAFAENNWPSELTNATELADSHDWAYAAERWTFERARVMGGCSSHNGCIAAVGHRRDYDDWQLPGWCGNDIEPEMLRVIEKMRVRTYPDSEAGPFHAKCIEAAKGLGWRIVSDLCDLDANNGFGLETVNILNTIRWNSAFAYLDPVRQQNNLVIFDRTLVNRFDESSGSVSLSIEREGRSHTLISDHLVLSAGVYGTPEIMQRSGVADPELLNELAIPVQVPSIKVGTNLHDHPMVHVDRRVGLELQLWLDEASRKGFLPEEQTLGKMTSSVAADGLFDLHIYPLCASTHTSQLHGRVHVKVACMTPKSRGSLRINSSDPNTLSTIDHNYLGDESGHDLAVLADGVEFANDLLDQPVLSALLGQSLTDTRTEAGIRRHVAHYYHPVGTCAMGLDENAVCDARGRVRGLQRVSIADASLMPQVPRANTNLPSVMIGARVAQFLTSGDETHT